MAPKSESTPENASVTGDARVKLDDASHFRLCQWLDSQRDFLVTECPTDETLAERACDDLKIVITPANIMRARRAVELNYKPAGDPLSQLRSNVRLLAVEVVNLCKAAGIEPSGVLTRLAR